MRTPNSLGDHIASVTIPKNTLLNGLHRVSAAVWNRITNEIYDDVEAIAEFNVEAAPEQAYLSEFSRSGLFQSPARWSFSGASTAAISSSNVVVGQ